jgi:transposase InsO family protein
MLAGHLAALLSRAMPMAAGESKFDQLCQPLGMEHCLTEPRAPRTSGMVERFNGRIPDVLKPYRLDSGQAMEQGAAVSGAVQPHCNRRYTAKRRFRP